MTGGLEMKELEVLARLVAIAKLVRLKPRRVLVASITTETKPCLILASKQFLLARCVHLVASARALHLQRQV